MDASQSFHELIAKARSNDPCATRELYERYGDHVRRVVRAKLHKRMRQVYETADFEQSVWKSFFAESLDRYQFDSPEAMVKFLAVVTFHKVSEKHRQNFKTERSNIHREYSLHDHPITGEERELPSVDPTPSQHVMADEFWDQLTVNEKAKYRRVLELLRDGYSQVAISRITEVPLSSIARLLKRLRGDES